MTKQAHFPTARLLRSFLAASAIVITPVWLDMSAAAQTTLLFSTSPDRASPVPLGAATVVGKIYAFTSPDAGVSRVRFYLDNPGATGTPRQTENTAPFDFAGTATDGSAQPFDTAQLTNGSHIITAAVDLAGGGTETLSGTFTVANDTPPGGRNLLVSLTPDRASPGPLDGASVAGNIYVFTSPDPGVSRVRFYLDNPGATGTPRQTESTAPFDFAGTAANGSAQAFDTAQLTSGSHVITAAIDLVGGGTETLSGTFTVAGSAPALVWSPTSTTLSVAQGGGTSAQIALAATTGTASFTVSESASWLTVSPTTGSTPASITLTVDAAGLAPGTYTTNVTAAAAGYLTGTLAVTAQVSGESPGGNQSLLVSTTPDRASPAALQSATVAGNIYVFTSPDAGVKRVRFFLDNPGMTGTPRQTETGAPFDFAGTAANGTAQPFNTAQLTDGSHVITAAVEFTSGGSQVVSGTFTVANNAPALAWSPDPVALAVPEGGSASTQANLNTTTGTAAFTVVENAPWLTVSPTSGSTPAQITLSVNAGGLATGTYTATLTANASGYVSDSVAVTLTVGDPGGCQPLACSEILVQLPYELEFDEDHGKIVDGAGIGTGFTYVDQPSKGTGYTAAKLAVDTAAGVLRITTTSGLASGAANSLDNALGVGIDAPSQITLLSTTLVNPPAGTKNFEQAGLWFGNNEDNYIKLIVLSNTNGTVVQLLQEVNGSQTNKVSPVLNLSTSTVELFLRADPTNRQVTGAYRVDNGALQTVGTFVAPPEFFSFDAAGIDPRIGTRSFGGIFASHRNGPAPLTYTFENFAVVADTTPPPPPTGDIAFDRSSFPVPFPTSMVWGPDNRLYVTELFGKIHALTLNASRQPIADQVITTLGSRLVLGITVDPFSTGNDVALWVSHSSPSLDSGVANSSTISRLSGPGFTLRQDVITGLPRAVANHAVNSIHFGPDMRLYIAAGGNTGAGAPNTANTEFKTRPEQPLSAALLVADVFAPGFQGACASWVDDATGTADKVIPTACHVRVFASGLRNMYDFVYHSNGFLYGPDNGLGVKGTVPARPQPDCQGIVTYSTALDPGVRPDTLHRLTEGGYHGHPNPARDECVFDDGTKQNAPPLPNRVAPIANLGNNRSANGTIEYLSEALCGELRGNILIANYSVGDNITRIRLAPDGLSVVAMENIASGFNNPLPLAQDPDGLIYVGELEAGRVTVLKPVNIGCWWVGKPLPQSILDASGAGLNGKVYVVAGKTSAGPQSTMHIYDPAGDTWTTGPNLPGPAVENPAVVAHNGRLYAFGGSTTPFSGAVTNAASFEPASGTWFQLAPMPTARGGATAQVVNGVIHVVGGMDGNGASLATVDIYNPSTNTWSTGSPMSTRRDNPGSAALGGKLYIFGGRTRNADGSVVNGTLNTVEMYDPGNGTWIPRASMPTGRRTMAVGTLNGRAQVMGGENTASGGTFPQNEEYDPVTNTWRTLKSMPVPRHGAATATVDGFVYVVGGGSTAGSSFTNLNHAFSFEP